MSPKAKERAVGGRDLVNIAVEGYIYMNKRMVGEDNVSSVRFDLDGLDLLSVSADLLARQGELLGDWGPYYVLMSKVGPAEGLMTMKGISVE